MTPSPPRNSIKEQHVKIGNKTPARVTRTITLDKPSGKVSFTVHALPLGFEEKVNEWLPFPKARKKWVQKKGEIALDRNGVPLSEEDTDDPVFQARYKKVVMLQGVAFVYEALRADPEVTFSTPVPPNPDEKGAMEAFFTAAMGEMNEANITAGDFRQLISTVREISLDKTKLFEEMREGF